MQEDLVVRSEFKDHFSDRSDRYAKYRPGYPAELFQYLGSVVTSHDVAWDCATGNGQAAVALASYFASVIATDASETQIEAALTHERVSYRTASAEASGLSDNSINLLTVGQALHWFDTDRFFAEAQRVLRPDGVLAIWCYELSNVNARCDAIVRVLYDDIVGDFWPPERAIIEQRYETVAIPGIELETPQSQMSLDWRVDDMLGFLRTWSACRRYEARHGTDPVLQIAAELSRAWGSGERQVTWPLTLKASRLNSPASMGA